MRRGKSLWRIKRRPTGGLAAPAQDGQSLTFRREFANARNFFDLFRGFVGAVALFGGLGMDAALAAGPDATRADAHRVLGIRVAILFVGLLLQTLRYERKRLSLAAPVFYIAGITAVVATPLAGLSAFAIAWAVSPIAPNVQGFLCVEAFVLGLLGVWLNGIGLSTILGCVLCFTPVLLSLLTRRPLIVFSRRNASRRSDV